jgi:hypothetical protein
MQPRRAVQFDTKLNSQVRRSKTAPSLGTFFRQLLLLLSTFRKVRLTTRLFHYLNVVQEEHRF